MTTKACMDNYPKCKLRVKLMHLLTTKLIRQEKKHTSVNKIFPYQTAPRGVWSSVIRVKKMYALFSKLYSLHLLLIGHVHKLEDYILKIHQ